AVAIARDAQRIAFGLSNSVIELFETKTRTSLGVLVGHRAPVLSVAFSPDGKRLVSLADDRTARIWDVEHARELFQYAGLDGFPRAILVSADGRRLVAATTQDVQLLPSNDPSAEVVVETEQLGDASFVANGTRVLTTSESGVELWDAATGKRLE